MGRRHNNFTYRLEMLVIRLRDLVWPPAKILQECGVRGGMSVLDFGCGPGGFSLAAARLVGPAGRVYAIDIEPAALATVRTAADRKGFDNLLTLTRDEIENLPAESVDVALLYDVLHIDPEAARVREKLRAIHRVLNPDGVLSVRDHHIKGARLAAMVTAGGLFRLLETNRSGSQFWKACEREGAA